MSSTYKEMKAKVIQARRATQAVVKQAVVKQDENEFQYTIDFDSGAQYYNDHVPAPELRVVVHTAAPELRVVLHTVAQELRVVLHKRAPVLDLGLVLLQIIALGATKYREEDTDVRVPKKTLLCKCYNLLQLVLIVLVAMCFFCAMLVYSTADDATTLLDMRSMQNTHIVHNVQQLKRKQVAAPLVSLQEKHSIWERPLQMHTVVSTALTAFVPSQTTTSIDLTDVVVMPLTDFKRFMANVAQTSVVVLSVDETKTAAPACVHPRDDAKHGNDTSNDAPVEIVNHDVFNGVCMGMAAVGLAVATTVVVSFVGGVIASFTGVGID
jgi:hypothetical protein